jgi:hypothetical protein
MTLRFSWKNAVQLLRDEIHFAGTLRVNHFEEDPFGGALSGGVIVHVSVVGFSPSANGPGTLFLTGGSVFK